MSRFSLFALAAALVATGCGLKELDAQQEARFTTSLGHVGKSVAAIQTTGKRYGGRQNNAANPLQRPEVRELVTALCAAGTTGGERDQDVEEIVDKMEKSVFAGDCKMPMDFPTKDAGKDLQEVRFSIEGEKCPMSLDFSMKPTGTPESMSAEFSIKYAVKDEDILAVTDIRGMEMTGTMSVSTSGVPAEGSTSMPSSFSMEMELDMKGTIHSQKEGDLNPYIKMSGSQEMNVSGTNVSASQDMEMTLGLEFKDFTGELTATISASNGSEPSVEYALNGKEITPQKFKSLMGKAGLDQMFTTPSPSNPDDKEIQPAPTPEEEVPSEE